MKISFNFSDGTKKFSPEFPTPSEEIMDYFWDEFLGGEDQSNEFFWNCDVSENGDVIEVHWFENPKNPQTFVEDIEKGLKTKLPAFSLWT